MKDYLVILVLAFSQKATAQSNFHKSEVSPGTEKVLSEIERVNYFSDIIYESNGTGLVKRDILADLVNVASKEELFKLIDYPIGVVRCYSFSALAYMPSIDLLPILIQHISDTERVRIQSGDESWRERVGDFMIDVASPDYANDNSSKVDSSQFARLDSFLIYTPNTLDWKAKAIDRAQPTEKRYPRLRELAVNFHDQTALVALAKFRKQQDIPLILQNREASKIPNDGFFYTYKAISVFPSPEFMPLLKKNLQATYGESRHYNTEWAELYGAIAEYRSREAVDLLESPLTKVKDPYIREYHVGFVFGAIEHKSDPIFDDLKWTLWQNEGRISSHVFTYLSHQNPQRAFELSKKSLANSDKLLVNNIGFESGDTNFAKSLPGIMLDLIFQKDSSLGIEIVRINLKQAGVHLYPIFSHKAAEIRSPTFVNVLFDRLEREDNPYIYLAAANALIAYKDQGIDKGILKARGKIKELRTGWGGKELDSLLKENNIN